MDDKKAQSGVQLYLVISILIIFLILTVTILMSVGAVFNVEMIKGQELIRNITAPNINNIGDADIKAQIGNVMQEGQDQSFNILSLLAGIFKYGGMIILVFVGIVGFIYSRNLVEFSGGGFV